jgi:hypothetical protein
LVNAFSSSTQLTSPHRLTRSMLSRFKQSARETLKSGSKDQKTEIPADVNSLMLKSDGVSSIYTDLITKATLYFPNLKIKTKHADDPVKAQQLYALAESFETLAGEYRAQSDASQFFLSASTTMGMLAKYKADMDKNVTEAYVEPKRVLINETLKEANSHFDKVKTRRYVFFCKRS